ncbi:ABC transporter permease [Bacillus toyonensis]|uniref:ABC transporter permease n=1 Tax=Bacillus toyonensis TaxID=155322 RepID=UPI0025411331|nr:ABC transporter permease [Bacillus toyonensis]WIG25096.1 ABC transporter permease [Bacillus toyonensis]
MLRLAISTELLKLKRSKMWIIMLCIPFICILLGLLNFQFNREVLAGAGKNEWIQAWTQIGMLYSMFLFPILIGVYSSLVCRYEDSGNNWNKILSLPISITNIYLSKLIVISLLSLVTQIFLVILYIISGNFLDFSHPFPMVLLKWVFYAWIGTISIASLQLWLSTSLKSFVVPIGIGVAFTFLGIIFYLMGIGYIWPFSYSALAMDPIKLHGIQGFKNTFFFFIMNIFYTTVFLFIGIRRMTRKDIK